MSPGYFASLNGLPLFKVCLVLPFSGIFHADVQMAVDVPLTPGPQLLMLAGASYTCSVIRATEEIGYRGVRLVGGTGGWRKAVPPKQYASPAGVPIAVVLADVAATVQEIPPVVDPSVPPTVGTAYVRQGGLASQVLQNLLGDAWWMDPTGTVQTAPRLPTPIVTPFNVTKVWGAPGIYEVATEYPSTWIPGMTFLSPTAFGTISRVTHTADGVKLRTEVMAYP